MTVVVSILWIALVVVVLMFAGYVTRENRRRVELPKVHARYKRAPLFTAAREVLYRRLVEALPGCVVVPHASVGRFIMPVTNGRVPLPQYRRLQENLAQMRVDYLICLSDFTLVAAVELNDPPQPQWRNEVSEEILREADIPVIWVQKERMPTAEELRTRFTHPFSPTRVMDAGKNVL